MLLGLETFSYHLAFNLGAMDVFGFIRRTAELGLDGVQINIVGPNWGHLGGAHPDHLEEVRRRCRDLGLYIELDTRGTAPAHLRSCLAVCRAVGADVLRTYASVGGHVPDELAAAVSDLREVLPLCAELEVRIALENHEYETAADVVQVVEAVGGEWLGVLVDTGNSMMVWEDPLAAVRTMAPYAVSSHLKDHAVIQIDGEPRVVGVTLGRGTASCAECFRVLLEDSPLERVNIECCYGYEAPFRRSPADGAGGCLGEGAFALLQPPFDETLLDPRHDGRTPDHETLLRLHDAAVEASVAYVRRLNTAAA